jgi:hypothetical protein
MASPPPDRQLHAGDTLTLTLIDAAEAPVWVGRGYRGLDRLKSRLAQGQPGVIIGLAGGTLRSDARTHKDLQRRLLTWSIREIQCMPMHPSRLQ